LAQQRQRANAGAWTATLHTADAGGSDGAGLAATGVLDDTHKGSATMMSFTRANASTKGGMTTFASARLTVDARNGRVRSVVLLNRARAEGRLAVAPPRLSRSRVTVHVHIAGVKGGAVIGVVVRVTHGRRTSRSGQLCGRFATERRHSTAGSIARCRAVNITIR
jgi:hypothetical protein